MAYEYDAFLSYKSGHVYGRWVHQHFLPTLKDLLANALNQREARIFCDTQEIPTGDTWTQTLQRALAYSRCLVAVWSPQYFKSEWCLRELSLILRRERECGYRTRRNPAGLIAPIKVFDGNHFPQIVQEIQCFDCSPYAIPGEGFERTIKYADFIDQMKLWVEDVAQVINQAPPWQETWLDYSLSIDPQLDTGQIVCEQPVLG